MASRAKDRIGILFRTPFISLFVFFAQSFILSFQKHDETYWSILKSTKQVGMTGSQVLSNFQAFGNIMYSLYWTILLHLVHKDCFIQ